MIRIGECDAAVSQFTLLLTSRSHAAGNESSRNKKSTVEARIDESLDVEFKVRVERISEAHVNSQVGEPRACRGGDHRI